MKTYHVLSVFDGIAGAYEGITRAGKSIGKYYASEIDGIAMQIAKARHPDIIHVGDVRTLSATDFKHIDILCGGSPCQSISVAGHIKGITTVDGTIIRSLEHYLELKANGVEFNSSSLFWEFVRLYREIKKYNPNLMFLLENVTNKYWEQYISDVLGTEAIPINSSNVSGQNRARNYWTNIPYTPVEDQNIMLSDVIPGAVSGAGYRGVPKKDWVPNPYDRKDFKHYPKLTIRPDGKANCITCTPGNTGKYLTTDNEIKDITPEQAEVLQTLSMGYTDINIITKRGEIKKISKSARFHAIGNGWTIDVVSK
jgi:hypothetical protein